MERFKREIKSSNVMLTREDANAEGFRAVVTDFGLARPALEREPMATLSLPGEVLGTRAYMAPEQLESGEITSAADIYAFGTVMYESDLLALVSRSGAVLREKLGGGKLEPREAEIARAALPATPEAARVYADGIEKLRVFDALGARAAFERAIAEDGRHALARAGLATAWSMMGYSKKANEQAQIATYREFGDRKGEAAAMTYFEIEAISRAQGKCMNTLSSFAAKSAIAWAKPRLGITWPMS